ncbi:alginate lyase family protein [Pseudoalteromonas sp. MMG010]|uniref:heparinase II/III domain-containing protein n=1 Tax=Pseudoalteromonas sp. MMG010 TaxID=2822685 RepID=UPI001B3A0CB6|nr:heparinase II/III family protein [Pseudoalteromonas sp. MMG010]MBQ4832945.1 alginate lyase family protein [Pseudoalteromonas sp. MMG010]
MHIKKIPALMLMTALCSSPFTLKAQDHPSLILNKNSVEKIRNNLGETPLFDATLQRVKQEVDAEIAMGIDTPIPKDFSGGYTHYRHKQNFIIAQKAGVLYQILQDEKYAIYIRDMLMQYEAMYKNLPLHPQERSYSRGKLFWQCLNDSNWLVYMSQAYDTIYNFLSEQERNKLENNLFRPFADFISLENPAFYNRVHNHSTWGNAAVGMIGLVMNDEELIQRALYGIEDDGLPLGSYDNDGGIIKVEGQRKGFLANLEEPFSPDGYYTEGPYYQRYAMYPFLIFALAMENARPDLKVLQHKDNVLLKAVDALLNLSDADGEFFPLNDGQKGMSYYTASLVTAVNIAYHYGEQNPKLLSIAQKQNQVLLDESGLDVAIGIREGKAKPYTKKSVNLTDGINGKQGGVGVLRYGNEDLTLVFKYAAQGLSHGHYDKLSYSLYEKGDEIIQDYGLARFVNIGQKGGGNYLKENKTWAKTTIAHNTLSQDGEMHFKGKYSVASTKHSDLYFFDADKEDVQVVSATEAAAYPGTEMHRTMALIKDEHFEKAFMLDIMKVSADKKHDYDFPFYYMGQVIDGNFKWESPKSLSPLGNKNGYQHLYLEGKGKPAGANTQFSWLHEGKFYTLTSATTQADELLLTRIGANDPQFNLRRDAGIVIRRKDTADTTFVSIIEPHGSYSPVSEASLNSSSNIKEVSVELDTAQYTAVKIVDLDDNEQWFILANKNASNTAKHSLTINKKTYRWVGPYLYQ